MNYLEIRSKDNKAVKHAVKLSHDNSYRKKCGEFIGEGEVMLYEALRSGIEVEEIFIADDFEGICNIESKLQGNIPIIITDKKIISMISSVETPQGIVFRCKIPISNDGIKENGGIIILEDVRDPGNIGTIIRTADAFSIGTVVLCGNCVDIYNPKIVRSAMGALFRVNIIKMDIDDIALNLKKKDIKLYGAILGDCSVDIRNIDVKNCAVAIGNEANGLSEQFAEIIDGKVIIPMTGQAESLNAGVAASIIMWEMSR